MSKILRNAETRERCVISVRDTERIVSLKQPILVMISSTKMACHGGEVPATITRGSDPVSG